MKKFRSQINFSLTVLLIFALGTIVSAQEMQADASHSIAIDIEAKAAELNWMDCPPFMPDGCNISILQGDPGAGNFDLLFKIPANAEVPNHWHTSPERMILLTGQLEVQYEGEDPVILNAGDYAYGPAKKPHTAKCGDNGPCTIFIAFEDPLDAHEVEN